MYHHNLFTGKWHQLPSNNYCYTELALTGHTTYIASFVAKLFITDCSQKAAMPHTSVNKHMHTEKNSRNAHTLASTYCIVAWAKVDCNSLSENQNFCWTFYDFLAIYREKPVCYQTICYVPQVIFLPPINNAVTITKNYVGSIILYLSRNAYTES